MADGLFCVIYEYFQMTGTHETLLDFTDLTGGKLRGDDVLGFDTNWNEVLLSIYEMPPDSIVESSHRTQLKESDQLRNVLAMYDMEILQKEMPPSYQRLKSMVKRFLDQKSKALNFEARHERTVTGAPAKSKAKGKTVSTERKQGDAVSGKEKESVPGEMPAVFSTILINVEQVPGNPLPV